jgi:hypothetical protein
MVETSFRYLEHREYQDCQACDRLRGGRNRSADRDCPFSFARTRIHSDSLGPGYPRH